MNIFDKSEAIIKDLKLYLSTSVELIRLETYDKSSEIGASLASRIIVWMAGIFALLFLSIGASLYLSDFLGSHYLGFGIVGGFYSVICLFLAIGRKSLLESPIRNRIVERFDFDQGDSLQEDQAENVKNEAI